MPQAIKDAASAAGFPTTYGSVLLKDNVARVDGVMVERMKAAGCIVIGKTNMPEFGLGSHTYNNLFGVTGNAWDPAASAPVAPAAAPRCAWRSACCRWPTAPTSWAACATPPAGTTCSACGRARAACRCGPPPTSGSRNSAPKARWRAACATSRPLLSIQAGHDPRAPLSIAQGPQDFSPHGADHSARRAHRLARRSGWASGARARHRAGVRAGAAGDGRRRCGHRAVELDRHSTSTVCGRPGSSGGACWWRRASAQRCAHAGRHARADQARGAVGVRPGAGTAGRRADARQRGAHAVARATAAGCSIASTRWRCRWRRCGRST